MSSLHVIFVGSPDPGAVAALRQRADVTLASVDAPAGAFSWESVATPVNEAIDEVAGWILLLREGERVPEPLAEEIVRLAADKPVAWAFRIPVSLTYDGGPLYRGVGRSGGEIRLFHSRRCRFLPKGSGKELQSRGTVIRIAAPLERALFSTSAEHVAALQAVGVPHSLPRRASIFLAQIWRDRRQLTLRTLRYHWIEAGWDRGRISGES